MTLEKLFIKLMTVSPDSSSQGYYKVTLDEEEMRELEKDMLNNLISLEEEEDNSEMNMREAFLEIREDREQFILFTLPSEIEVKVYFGDQTKIEMLNGN